VRRILPVALILFMSVAVLATDRDSAEVTSHIPRQHVESSALRSVGFSKRRYILEIEFTNGAIYRYADVPTSVYRDLLSADSKACYYDLNIKRNYISRSE
jgi:KTSC domain-containing protein